MNINADKDIETFCPANRQDWRRWLEEHHHRKQSIWLVYCKKESNLPTVTWSEAVDEALCFGWIDSTKRPIDDKKFMQLFSKRKPNSVWSKINKEKVERLIEHKLMTQAGLEIIKTAKQNGTWVLLDDVEALKIPQDLEEQFKIHPSSESFFLSLSRSDRKSILQWLVLAKKTETRQKRITEIVELAARGFIPQQFR